MVYLVCNKSFYFTSGMSLSLTRFWTSVVFRLQVSSDKFETFSGPNASVVVSAYERHQSNWMSPPTINLWKSKDVRVNPFTDTCAGVATNQGYEVVLHIYRVNYWQVCLFTRK